MTFMKQIVKRCTFDIGKKRQKMDRIYEYSFKTICIHLMLVHFPCILRTANLK